MNEISRESILKRTLLDVKREYDFTSIEVKYLGYVCMFALSKVYCFSIRLLIKSYL